MTTATATTMATATATTMATSTAATKTASIETIVTLLAGSSSQNYT